MAASLDDIRLDQPASEIPERQDAADAPEFNQPSINDQLTIQLIEDKKADRALRERFGDKAYKVVRKTLYGWCWLLAIYAAIKFRYDKEIFSENVLIAITSAVTLNVFAAFLGVIRGLFPSTKPTKE
ncbi:hypothetical protein VXI92_002818 [Enterobacter hormaechei]|uniref:Uncharacterized protein n=1 Tax=Enterobacter mori TaxID=539813 RepID=A0A9Q7NRR7_9ENTR|nr:MULTISPECIES: hypothetical protein [Enterobacter]HAS0840383.1 hypothetical protein [Enterobacter hormaechei subsp. xiangfangensis]EKY1422913.1 hypothetical protein [Enterobacter hormaechei]ELC6409949.1 hypothetical protein [Enterobacter hormaechei]EME0310161.1 hypothetical protein [Enterobacter hormaechei]MBF9269086.1 hypothetical protein [Enterobacter hormaechei]